MTSDTGKRQTGAAVTGADGAAGGRRIAIALDYDDASAGAPRVVASGKGAVADAILAAAFANDVKVRTDPDLAAILGSVDVGEEIPIEAFVAVAEILSYLYAASAPRKESPVAALRGVGNEKRS